MFKKYLKQNLLSSALILLPIVVGLILWNTLPDRFATHWGVSGDADGWSTKAFAIFVHPLTLLALHWLCFWITTKDPKAKDQTKKAFGMVFWICPVISILSSAVTYALALGAEFNIISILMPGIALMFIAIGNYLPKCKQNYTMGIKVPWALSNEENWNATHRFGGRLWVFGGIAMLVLTFIPGDWAFFALMILIFAMALLPVLYSWNYWKKQRENGTASAPAKADKRDVAIMKGTFIFMAIVFILIFALLLSGRIDVVYSDTSFTIDPTYWHDLTVNYADIDSLEYRDGNVDGTRTWGFGSWRLLLGTFQNDEFGNYTRYTYYKPEACIVLTCGEKTLVISGKDAAETHAIYKELTARTEG